MVVIVTCKNDENPIRNMGARVFTTLYIIFSEAQGQVTPQSLVKSGRNSNSSKLLWLSSLSARMKKIQSKIKEIECSQHFSHYKSIGIFRSSRAANSAVLIQI